MNDVLRHISASLDLPVSAGYDQDMDTADDDGSLDEQAQTIARLFVLIPTLERRNQVMELIQKLVP